MPRSSPAKLKRHKKIYFRKILSCFVTKAEERPPEEKENTESGTRGRKRLGDLGSRGRGGDRDKFLEKYFQQVFREILSAINYCRTPAQEVEGGEAGSKVVPPKQLELLRPIIAGQQRRRRRRRLQVVPWRREWCWQPECSSQLRGQLPLPEVIPAIPLSFASLITNLQKH